MLPVFKLQQYNINFEFDKIELPFKSVQVCEIIAVVKKYKQVFRLDKKLFYVYNEDHNKQVSIVKFNTIMNKSKSDILLEIYYKIDFTKEYPSHMILNAGRVSDGDKHKG